MIKLQDGMYFMFFKISFSIATVVAYIFGYCNIDKIFCDKKLELG